MREASAPQVGPRARIEAWTEVLLCELLGFGGGDAGGEAWGEDVEAEWGDGHGEGSMGRVYFNGWMGWSVAKGARG